MSPTHFPVWLSNPVWKKLSDHNIDQGFTAWGVHVPHKGTFVCLKGDI